MPSELWLKIFLFPGLLLAPIWGAYAVQRRRLDLRWLTPALLMWLALLARALGVALLLGVIALCHARERLGPDAGRAKWRQELSRAAVGTAVLVGSVGLWTLASLLGLRGLLV